MTTTTPGEHAKWVLKIFRKPRIDKPKTLIRSATCNSLAPSTLPVSRIASSYSYRNSNSFYMYLGITTSVFLSDREVRLASNR